MLLIISTIQRNNEQQRVSMRNNSLNKEIDYITKKCKENFYYSTRYKIYCYKNLLSKFNKHKSKYLDLFYYKTNSPSLDEVSPSSGNSNITKEINYSIVKECSTNTCQKENQIGSAVTLRML